MARLPFSLFKQGESEYEVKDLEARKITSKITLSTNATLSVTTHSHGLTLEMSGGSGPSVLVDFADGSASAGYKIALMINNMLAWKYT